MKSENQVRKIYEVDRVIIRIWTSGLNKLIKGEDVGHISIEIPSIAVNNPKYDEKYHTIDKKTIPFYASLWPARAIPEAIRTIEPSENIGFFKGENEQLLIDVSEDIKAEGRKPEYIQCLYSLDIDRIQSRFEEIKQNLNGWVLIGSNKLINQNNEQSCSSLATELLLAGKIEDLIPSSYCCKYSAITSPDLLMDLTIKAKESELKKYDETQHFLFKDNITDQEEYDVNSSQSIIRSSKCIIQ